MANPTTRAAEATLVAELAHNAYPTAGDHGYPPDYTEAQWAADNGVTQPPAGDPLCEAAADLLAACKMTLAHMWDDELDAPTAAQLEGMLLAAIAKAEGRVREAGGAA